MLAFLLRLADGSFKALRLDESAPFPARTVTKMELGSYDDRVLFDKMAAFLRTVVHKRHGVRMPLVSAQSRILDSQAHGEAECAYCGGPACPDGVWNGLSTPCASDCCAKHTHEEVA